MSNKGGGCCMRNFCGPYEDQACGYPPKTVRSIIAVMFAIGVLLIEGFLVIYFAIEKRSNEAIAIAGLLMSEFSGIGGYYYGSRSSSKTNEQSLTNHTGNDSDSVRDSVTSNSPTVTHPTFIEEP